MKMLALSAMLMLSVGCEAEAQEPDVEPWIVTSLSAEYSDSGVDLLAEFTAPGGNERGQLELSMPGAVWRVFTDSPAWECWQNARIAEPLPECLRSVIIQ